ncbi:MAG: hypothetical protein Q9174_003164 [Haloplaca sp. 1 TL-2023]
MDIETYIHEEDPYRHTSQASPWPLPLLESRSDEEAQLHARRLDQKLEWIEELTAILMDHKIQCRDKMGSFGMWSKPGYQKGDKKLMMFRIEAVATSEKLTHTWASARKAVSELLSRHGCGEIIVEIVDTNRAFSLSLLPVGPDHVAVRAYGHCRQALIKVLHNHLDTRWINISLYRVIIGSPAIPHRAESIAVVVMVPPYTVGEWHTIRQQLSRALLLTCSNIAPINVFFVPGNNGMSAVQHGDYTSKSSYLQDTLPYPSLGQSLGFSDEVGGGTLGGFFRFHLGGKLRNGFLTSCQAVTPHEEPSKDRGTNSSIHDSLSDPSLRIVSPHKEDTRLAVEWYRNSKRKHVIIVDETRRRIARSGSFGISRKELERMLGSQRKVDEYTRREITRMTLSTFISDVLLSSGGRLDSEGQILDWAFVEITDDSVWNSVVDMNVLPSDMAFETPAARHDLGQQAADMYSNVLRLALEEFTDMMRGSWYFKIGSTTGLTSGICNGVQLTVNMTHGTCDDTRSFLPPHRRTSSAYIVLNGSLARDDEGQRDFCQGGDSGSLLVDSSGHCAGLMYGTLQNYTSPLNMSSSNRSHVGIGMVTGMDSVLKSIHIRANIGGSLFSGNAVGAPVYLREVLQIGRQ